MGDRDVVDLCVVGAGLTGLNALVVATEYLSSSDTVVLVDSRSEIGGMWTDTYDYVRLHQPHRMFTAGSVRWRPRRPASHLASRDEVLRHLADCRRTAADRVRLDERLGFDFVSHHEHEDHVEVTLRSADGSTSLVRTRKLVKAFGNRTLPSVPLTLSSRRVRSVTPESLDLEALRASDEPVFLIGGGKTAMDTALLLLAELPGRQLHLVDGPGTLFARRDTFFPTGAARWFGGTPVNAVLRQVCEQFDGTNEQEVREWYRPRYGVSAVDGATDFLSAYLSVDEAATIRGGLASVEHEYLVDAVDAGADVELVFRSGQRRKVGAGSWVVSCTGLLLRDRHDYEPAVSGDGRVLSIQQSSSVTGPFTGFGGYYLTHLMMLGRLHQAGLYELDLEGLAAKNRQVAMFAAFALALYNLGQISRAVPSKVMMGCGLDLDRWYPAPRRALGAVQFLRARDRMADKNRRTLDALADRYDVRCGPLDDAPTKAGTHGRY